MIIKKVEWNVPGNQNDEPRKFFGFLYDDGSWRFLREDGMEVRAYEVPASPDLIEIANRVLYTQRITGDKHSNSGLLTTNSGYLAYRYPPLEVNIATHLLHPPCCPIFAKTPRSSRLFVSQLREFKYKFCRPP